MYSFANVFQYFVSFQINTGIWTSLTSSWLTLAKARIIFVFGPAEKRAVANFYNSFTYRQRGLIYIEHKSLSRLYKMFDPFFHEFRVIPVVLNYSFRQQMDSSSSAILLLYSPQRLYARGLTLIGVLLTLAGREGQWAMFFFSQSRLLRQRPLSCKTLLIPATGSLVLAFLT